MTRRLLTTLSVLLLFVVLLAQVAPAAAQGQTVVLRCALPRQSDWEAQSGDECVRLFLQKLGGPTEFWIQRPEADRPAWTRLRYADVDLIVYLLYQGVRPMLFYVWQVEGAVVVVAHSPGAFPVWGRVAPALGPVDKA